MENQNNQKNKNYAALWKNMRNYRSMWVDRVFAEKQIKIILGDNFSNTHEHFKYVNNYAAYLHNAVK